MEKNFKNAVNKNIYGREPLNRVREISTLRDMLDSSCELFAERTAFLRKTDKNSPYEEISYSTLKKDVYAFATGMISRGYKDKKTAIISENRYEWAVAYLSVVCGTGTVVPIDKELPFEEIKRLLDFAEVSAVICSKNVLKQNPQLSDCGISCICMDDAEDTQSFCEITEEGKRLLNNGDTAFAGSIPDSDDVNILLFTSGTTGNPKGVMLSHRNICSNIMNICVVFKITEEDRVFSVLPLHHTYECTCGFLCEIYAGSSIVYCQGLKHILKNMQETSPTMFFMVPLIIKSIYRVLNKSIDKLGMRRRIELGLKISRAFLKVGIDLRRLLFRDIINRFGGKIKMFLVGGAAVDADISRAFTDFGILTIQGYGMTECSPMIAENRASHYRDDSVGMPLPEVEVTIENPDGDGIGEIAVKGDNVTCGYYRNAAATNEVIKNGRLFTGDMGYIKDGFLYITGRAKDVIITSNGKNVFPEEIEGYLNKSEIIAESMVYEEDNCLCAQIYPDFAEIKRIYGELTEEELHDIIGTEIKKINSGLPHYKVIARFKIRHDEFVKTTTKKIKRYANMQ